MFKQGHHQSHTFVDHIHIISLSRWTYPIMQAIQIQVCLHYSGIQLRVDMSNSISKVGGKLAIMSVQEFSGMTCNTIQNSSISWSSADTIVVER